MPKRHQNRPKSRRRVKSQCLWGWNAGDSGPLPLQEGAQGSESEKQARSSTTPTRTPPEHTQMPKPQTERNDCVTSGSNTVETNKCIETGRCSTENPLEAERHKPSRAQRAQAKVKEGVEKVRACSANSCSFSLRPNYLAGSSRPRLPFLPTANLESLSTDPSVPRHAPSSASPESPNL